MKAYVAAILALSVSSVFTADPNASAGDSFSLVGKASGGGGGTVQSGKFTLTSTIGEASAGRLTGGVYQLQGGFIGVLIGDTVGGDAVLKVTLNTDGQAALTWDVPGYALEFRNLLGGAGDWQTVDLPAAVVRYATPANLPARFFRLRLR